MAAHHDQGSGKQDNNFEEEEQDRTSKFGGLPESPQRHACPLSPDSLSWEDEAFPDTFRLTKGSEENISEEVRKSSSDKGGQIPGKFSFFLQEPEDNIEDFLDEEEDDLYATEGNEVNSSGRGELQSILHSEDNISVQNCKVSISSVRTEKPSISATHKEETSNLMKAVEEYAQITSGREIEKKYSSLNKKQQGTTNLYDEKRQVSIAVEAHTRQNMPSICDWDQEMGNISDEGRMSSCQPDEVAYVFKQQQKSSKTFTQEQGGAHMPRDQKNDIPSLVVENTVGSSFKQQVGTKVLEQEEPPITECIQQGELLLHRLHVVQQKHQSPEESEEFPVMTNQQAVLVGCREAREKESSLTGPAIEVSCGERKDGDDAAAGPSHWQSSTEGLEVSQIPGGRAGARAETQLSGGDDQSKSQACVDFQASIATSTAVTQHSPSGTPAQRMHESEGRLQPKSNVGSGPKGEGTEQISGQKSSLKGQSSSAKMSVAQGDKGQESAGKWTGQQIKYDVKTEEELIWLERVLGAYSEDSVQKFKERRMLFEAFQQAKPSETKPSSLRRNKIMLPTSTSEFSLPSVSTWQVPKECICPPVSVMERARSLEQLSQAQEVGVPWHRDTGWGSQAGLHELDRIIVKGDVTVVHGKKPLRPSHSSESLCCPKEDEKQEEGVGECEQNEDESSVLHRPNPFFKLRPSLALRPDVARDIQDAWEREKELQELRKGLYGSWKAQGHNRGCSGSTTTSQRDSGSMAEDYQSKGKLDLVWPPPYPTEKVSQSDQTQELKPLISPSQKALLWQRWETGVVNGHMEGED